MAINSMTEADLLIGPAYIYYKTAGFSAANPTANEPADSAYNSAPASSSWTFLGPTDGLTQKIDETYVKLKAGQKVDPMGARRTAREVSVATSMQKMTLANLKWALNGGTFTSGGTVDAYTPDNESDSGVVPPYSALLVDGYAPGGYRRRVILRKVLSTGGVSWKASMEDQSAFDVSVDSFYVDDSTPSFRISQDPTAE